MSLEEVLTVLHALDAAGVETWLEGGWGIDALVGRQTRPHRDLDLDLDVNSEGSALAVLEDLGYVIETDWRPTRVELAATGRGWVDVHPLQFDRSGDARQEAPGGTFWEMPRRFFTHGRLADVRVGCFTVEAQRQFHRGYLSRVQDRLDLEQLDQLEAARRTR